VGGNVEMDAFRLQFNACLVLLLTGMVWGGFFDLYRVFRSRIKVNKAIDFIGDLLFWIFTAIIIIPLIFWATWLELRLYVWIAIILGLVIYFSIFSSLFIPLFKLFWQGAGWLPGVLSDILWRIRFNMRRISKFIHRE
jgi:High-affinity K+ transport system, ATPase chain B